MGGGGGRGRKGGIGEKESEDKRGYKMAGRKEG